MPVSSPRRLLGLLLVAGGVACGNGGDSPSAPTNDVSAVQVTSPIDTLLARNAHVTLAVALTGSKGQALTGPVTWQSSDASVVSVDGSGQIQANAVGSATISATAGGKTGQLRLRVINPDLPGIQALLSDPLVTQFGAALTTSSKSTLQTSINSATQGIASGNLVSLVNGLNTAAAATSTDANDRAILATLSLIVDQATRLVHLSN